jgi:ureidoacrylate peracid hydrolase
VSRFQQILNPARTAVLVVDVQNDFVSPEGMTAKRGVSVTAGMAIVPALRAFLDEARARSIPVVFIHASGTPWTESEAWLHRASEAPRTGNCREGTWGAQGYELVPGPDDVLVIKHRNSGFHGTRLDVILRARKIDTVVATGVATNVSVEMTARDAVQHDYNLVVPEDLVAAYTPEQHANAIFTLRTYYGYVVPSADVLHAWNSYGKS